MDLSLRSIRKNIAALSVFAIIASMLVVTGVANAAATDVYEDVNGGEWYEADVNWGLDNGVLDDTQAYFRAADNASRAEFFTMVARGAGIPETACDETLFPDLNADHWGCTYLTALAEAGVIAGDGAMSATPGYVRPNDPINRAEAAKVVVEAFQLEGTRLGSDVFTDVEAGIWYDGYMGIANENCVFSGVNNGTTVEPAREINRAESITVIQRGANPTTDCAPVIEAGALTVALDGSSPDAVSVPKNGANIPYAVFALTASAEEAINVEELILTRIGLGLPSDFTSVKLYVDGLPKGSERTVNTSTNTVTFSLASSPIEVAAGATVLVEVRADMAGRENSQNAFCVNTSDDATGYGDASMTEVSVGGAFAVCGNLMTTTSASVGTLTYSIDDYTGDVNVGEMGVPVSKLELNVDGVEDVDVTKITLKQTGSADPEDFANPELYVSGTLISSTATWNGDFVTFDLSEAPLYIERGNSKTVEVRMDVVGGLGSNIKFDVYRDWNIEGTGRVYWYGVNVVETLVPPALVARNIVGCAVAFALSANNPTAGDVARGARDYALMKFNISTAGDAIKLDRLVLDVVYAGATADANELQDVKIWTKNSADTWVTVFGPLDPATAVTPGTTTLTYNDSWDIPASTTKEFMVTADVQNTAPNGAIYHVELNSALAVIEYSSSGTPVAAADVSGGTLVGNNKQVALPTLTVTTAAVPANQNAVGGKLDLEVINWDLAASSADDLKVNSVTVTCNYPANIDPDGPGPLVADTDVCQSVFSNVQLFAKSGSTYLPIGGTRSFSAANPGTVTFNSLNLSVPAGSTKKLALKMNVSKSPEAGETAVFSIAANTDISAEDTRNPLTGAQILVAPVVTRTVTIVGTGTLTVSVDGATPGVQAVAGAEGKVEVAKIKLKADNNEGIILQKLRLRNDPAGAVACEADSVVSKVYLTDGTTEYEATLSGGMVLFNNANYTIPRNSEKVLTVLVDSNEVGPSSSPSGVCGLLAPWRADGLYTGFDLAVPTMDIKAIGESSGAALD